MDMAANPYVQGWREWDERYADLVLGKRNWQIAAGCSLLISLVLAVGMVWLALRSRCRSRQPEPAPPMPPALEISAARVYTSQGRRPPCR